MLFGNCAIKTNYIKAVNGFNEKLLGYGGEEIELLYRIKKDIKKLKILKTNATVVRINHPNLKYHCNRLVEFGKTNFKLLPYEIQQRIIPDWIIKFHLFIPVYLLLLNLRILNVVCRGKSIFVIKAILGLSILRGYKTN